ncbi:MAG: non-ribosomal peptide synthetase, partial [Bacteroidota bacterium]
FDAFLRDIFAPLLAGGTICVPPREDDFFTFDKMRSWINEQEITLIHCVPSVFKVLNSNGLSQDDLGRLKYVLMSGEKIAPASLKPWYQLFEDRIQLVNFYGTTEVTMIQSMYKIQPKDVNRVRMPIGNPIPDTELLILDEEMKSCRPLITGDLYIVTRYGSKGYLNNDQLNDEKFITRESGDIAFKTGDKARTSADGNIEILGRDDRQIKLNGIRVELDEIESVISEVEEITEVVVTEDKDQPGTLIAFVIKNKTEQIDDKWKSVLTDHLANHLPAYMIPADFVSLDSFPRLFNGKLNYKKLMESRVSTELVQPANDMETRVLDIWKEVLNKQDISVTATIQSVGGNSLSIMRLIAKIYSEYNIRLALSEIFSHSTIRKQAGLLEDKIVEQSLEGAEA